MLMNKYVKPELVPYGSVSSLTAASGVTSEADANDFPESLPGFGSIDGCKYEGGEYIGDHPEACRP